MNSFISGGGVGGSGNNTNLRTTINQVFSNTKSYLNNSYISKSYTPTPLKHTFSDRSRSIDMCSPYDNNSNNNHRMKFNNDSLPSNNKISNSTFEKYNS